jgi:hypothetical protein
VGLRCFRFLKTQQNCCFLLCVREKEREDFDSAFVGLSCFLFSKTQQNCSPILKQDRCLLWCFTSGLKAHGTRLAVPMCPSDVIYEVYLVSVTLFGW